MKKLHFPGSSDFGNPLMVGAAAQQAEIPLRSIITQKRERIQNHVEVHCRSQRNDVRDVRSPYQRRCAQSLPVKKVHSSRAKCQTVVLSEAELDPETIAAASAARDTKLAPSKRNPIKREGSSVYNLKAASFNPQVVYGNPAILSHVVNPKSEKSFWEGLTFEVSHIKLLMSVVANLRPATFLAFFATENSPAAICPDTAGKSHEKRNGKGSSSSSSPWLIDVSTIQF